MQNLTGLHTDKKRVKDSFTLVVYVFGLVTLQQPWCDERVGVDNDMASLVFILLVVLLSGWSQVRREPCLV